MNFETFYQKNIEGAPPTKRNKALTELRELIKQGKFSEFDDLVIHTNSTAYENAIDFFSNFKFNEWKEIIKDNKSEDEKKDFIQSLPKSIYQQLQMNLWSIATFRDCGIAAMNFKESVGKSVKEVIQNLNDSWEKYNTYKQKDVANPDIQGKNGLEDCLGDENTKTSDVKKGTYDTKTSVSDKDTRDDSKIPEEQE